MSFFNNVTLRIVSLPIIFLSWGGTGKSVVDFNFCRALKYSLNKIIYLTTILLFVAIVDFESFSFVYASIFGLSLLTDLLLTGWFAILFVS